LVNCAHNRPSPEPVFLRCLLHRVFWERCAESPNGELSDAGRFWPPHRQLTRPARVRSSAFVRHHSVNSSLKSSFAPLHRPPPQVLPVQLERLRFSQASLNCALINGNPFISVP